MAPAARGRPSAKARAAAKALLTKNMRRKDRRSACVALNELAVHLHVSGPLPLHTKNAEPTDVEKLVRREKTGSSEYMFVGLTSSGLLRRGWFHRTCSSGLLRRNWFVGTGSSGLGSSELVRRNWFVGTGFVGTGFVGTCPSGWFHRDGFVRTDTSELFLILKASGKCYPDHFCA